MYSDREKEILEAIWAYGRDFTAQELQDTLTTNWHAANLQQYLKRLLSKKAIRKIGSKKTGLRHNSSIYEITVTKEEVYAKEFDNLSKSRLKGMVSAFVNQEKVSKSELEEIQMLIAEKMKEYEE